MIHFFLYGEMRLDIFSNFFFSDFEIIDSIKNMRIRRQLWNSCFISSIRFSSVILSRPTASSTPSTPSSKSLSEDRQSVMVHGNQPSHNQTDCLYPSHVSQRMSAVHLRVVYKICLEWSNKIFFELNSAYHERSTYEFTCIAVSVELNKSMFSSLTKWRAYLGAYLI